MLLCYGIVLDTDGTKKVVRLSEAAAVESASIMASPAAPDTRPKKGGRLGIIMRKVSLYSELQHLLIKSPVTVMINYT